MTANTAGYIDMQVRGGRDPITVQTLTCTSRDFKMPRRPRRRERQKSNRLNRQNNNSPRASPFFFIHFFAVTARLRRENAYLHVLWKS